MTQLDTRHQSEDYIHMNIVFDSLIKSSSSYLAYTGLELMAELGGYVGLFLGVSIFHLKDAFDKLVQRCV